jgi:hypothetical protein
VGPERSPRTLVAARQPGYGAADSRPDPMGRRREALPHDESVSVPHRRAERARERGLGD